MTEPEFEPLKRLFGENGLAGPTPLANQLQAVARIVIRSALRRYPKQLELTFVDAAVIGGIGTLGPLPARDLAVLLTMHEGQLSRTIKGLVKNGLIERITDPSDSRRKMLMLTKAGKPLYRQIITIQNRREEQFRAGVSDSDWAVFQKTLTRIRANAEAVLADESLEP